MSLNRVTSLESWEFHPSSFHQRERPCQEHADSHAPPEDAGGDDTFPNSSTLLIPVVSRGSQNAVMRKLNFNPAAGPAWTHAGVDSEDDQECRRSQPSVSDEDSALILTDGDWEPDTLAAFEVPKWKRVAQVFVAVLYCVLSAGVIFGYAALKPILIEEGVYRNRCTKEEFENEERLCYNQDLRLNFMFTLAAAATNICALPAGAILDTFGPRFSGSVGSIFIASGSLCLGLASLLPFDTYIAGYFLLAIGGPFVFISAFQLSNTFPAHSGLILAILTGAFDSSSALFLLFRIIHGGFFTLRSLFLLYLIVPTFIFISQILLMPSSSYKTAGELIQQVDDVMAEHTADISEDGAVITPEQEQQLKNRTAKRKKIISNILELLGSNDPPNITTSPSEPPRSPKPPNGAHKPDSIWGVLHMASALQQTRSPYFILMSIFTALQMLRVNYFIATIDIQYEYLLSSTQLAKHVNSLFDISLPAAGIVAVPFVGLILDRTSTITILATLVGYSTLIGILGCIPHSLSAAYANIILFTLYRPFYYSSISDFAAKVFGFQTFGKVYGLMICLAGLGNFLQVPLDVLTLKLFRRNPIPMNILLTIVVFVAGGLLVLFVWWQGRERMGIVDVIVENGELREQPRGGVPGDHSNKDNNRTVRKRGSGNEPQNHAYIRDDRDGEWDERDRLVAGSRSGGVNGNTRAYGAIRDG
ncbi:MFS transporter [Histoplasma capsulatum var. duboisii H88]|uniref:MFS transporter n=1 Tax=Ajellomyces capsulatus (strain H88) TaxID=544711 RepID=F0UKA8_AJEC8|nr:MFS transporter [Histoplasma capsulatum var. duboisii H88]